VVQYSNLGAIPTHSLESPRSRFPWLLSPFACEISYIGACPLGRKKGSKNASRAVAKSSKAKPAKKAVAAPKKAIKTRSSSRKTVTVVEKDLPDRKSPKKVLESKSTMDYEEVTRLLSAGMLKYDEPTCYVCNRVIKCPWEEVPIDKPNNVYRHFKCSNTVIRRWYLSMGMKWEPKEPSKRNLIKEETFSIED